MPPASDPRNIANPTGETSYRFQIAWEGKTPVKVNLDEIEQAMMREMEKTLQKGKRE